MSEGKAVSKGISKKILVFITVILVFFIIEWMCRFYISWTEYFILEDTQWHISQVEYERLKKMDYEIGYYFSADGVTTVESGESCADYEFIDLGVDSLRFRDDGIDEERKYRLLSVGDSFSWGYGIQLDEVFSELLEAEIDCLDVINASISGQTPQQYTRVLARFVKNDCEFDGVLYNFYSGNDVSEEYNFREWAKFIKLYPELAGHSYTGCSFVSQEGVGSEVEKMLIRYRKPTFSGFINRFIGDWIALSKTGNEIVWRLKNKFIKNLSGGKDGRGNSQNYYFPDQKLISLKNRRSTKVYGKFINSAAGETIAESKIDYRVQFSVNFPLLLESISEAKSICDSLQRDFYFVYLPDKAEVYSEELCRGLPSEYREKIEKKLFLLHDTLTAKLDSMQIEVIDLLPVFRRYPDTGAEIFFRKDIHCLPAGHVIWSQEVLRRLEADSFFD